MFGILTYANSYTNGTGYGMYWDPTMILLIIGAVITLIASGKMKSTFSKYSKIRSMSGLTGSQAAERILSRSGIYDVKVERIAGDLTDHYDPKAKVLRLSDSVYNSGSVAAIGVAAHECGHAIQHQEEYAPLKIRGAIVPAVNISSKLAWPIIIIGFLFNNSTGDFFLLLGILLFSAAVVFQLVTLPVEFDASTRAVACLEGMGIMGDEEIRDTKKVLTAAALTYVASAAATILQLLRLIMIFGGRRRD